MGEYIAFTKPCNTCVTTSWVKLMPQTAAPGHSRAEIAVPAKCTHTKAALQAVSTLMDGPCAPYVNESRPDATLRAEPVAVKALSSGWCCPAMRPYSVTEIPTANMGGERGGEGGREVGRKIWVRCVNRAI